MDPFFPQGKQVLRLDPVGIGSSKSVKGLDCVWDGAVVLKYIISAIFSRDSTPRNVGPLIGWF